MPVKILFVDDHEVFHECLKTLLEDGSRYRMVGAASDGRSAVLMARDLKPDVVIMDVTMPVLNGIEATRQIVSDNPGIKVVALSSHADRRFILAVLKAGARGYVVKESAFSEVLQSIDAVLEGKMYLSPRITSLVIDDLLAGIEEEDASILSRLSEREREVLQMLAEGQGVKTIAEKLNLSPKTIETHRTQLMRKLEVTSLADLTKIALREGLTSL